MRNQIENNNKLTFINTAFVTKVNTKGETIMNKNLSIHPGQFLKEDILEFNNLSVTGAAELLGTTRINLSNILNEKTAITPNMAIRISKVFGGTPEIWLRLQMKYDLLNAIEEFEEKNINLQEFHYS